MIGGYDRNWNCLEECLYFNCDELQFKHFSNLQYKRRNPGVLTTQYFIYVFAGYGDNECVSQIEKHNM